jgi:hypothetical protein
VKVSKGRCERIKAHRHLFTSPIPLPQNSTSSSYTHTGLSMPRLMQTLEHLQVHVPSHRVCASVCVDRGAGARHPYDNSAAIESGCALLQGVHQPHLSTLLVHLRSFAANLLFNGPVKQVPVTIDMLLLELDDMTPSMTPVAALATCLRLCLFSVVWFCPATGVPAGPRLAQAADDVQNAHLAPHGVRFPHQAVQRRGVRHKGQHSGSD